MSPQGEGPRGLTVTTTTDEVVFPGPDEIEGFWALDKMHAPRPGDAAVVRPRRAHARRRVHQGPGRVRLPGDGDDEGDQPLPLRRLPPAPRRGRDPAPPAHATTRSWPPTVPKIGKTWEEQWKPAVIATNVPLKTADYAGLGDDELVAKLDELTDEMRHQWWIHGHINFVLLSSSAFCDLYDKVDAAERTDRVVPDPAGLPHPLGRCGARPVGAQPRRQGQPVAGRAVRHDDARELLGGARRQRGGTGASAASSTTSCSSSAGATTRCSTWPTCRGGRT